MASDILTHTANSLCHTYTHTHTHTHIHRLVWSLFLIFTFFHLLANYKAVSVVKMETLNQNRLHTVISDLLSSGKVPDPASTNAREPIVLWSELQNC